MYIFPAAGWLTADALYLTEFDRISSMSFVQCMPKSSVCQSTCYLLPCLSLSIVSRPAQNCYCLKKVSPQFTSKKLTETWEIFFSLKARRNSRQSFSPFKISLKAKSIMRYARKLGVEIRHWRFTILRVFSLFDVSYASKEINLFLLNNVRTCLSKH